MLAGSDNLCLRDKLEQLSGNFEAPRGVDCYVTVEGSGGGFLNLLFPVEQD